MLSKYLMVPCCQYEGQVWVYAAIIMHSYFMIFFVRHYVPIFYFLENGCVESKAIYTEVQKHEKTQFYFFFTVIPFLINHGNLIQKVNT